VVRHFIEVQFDVLGSTTFIQSILFTTPCNVSDGSLWLQTERSNHSEGFIAIGETTSIVIGSSLAPHIPTVNVASKDNNLLWMFCALQLSHHIE
jgi:hypothetical protein